MNREKLDKAIIRAFREYDSEDETHAQAFSRGFDNGADWLMLQPLSERLTDEEKERIKEIYWQAAKDWINIGDARGHCRTCIAIETIFGSDLFKEK